MLLDTTDLRILDELQRDGASSNIEWARRVHLAPSPCLVRVKPLQAAGATTRHIAMLNAAAALGRKLNVVRSIRPKAQSKASLAEFKARSAEHDEVVACHPLIGDSGCLVRVLLVYIGALEKSILEQLKLIPSIEKIRSSSALKQVRYKIVLLLQGHRTRRTE